MESVGRRGFFGALGALITEREVKTRPPYARDSTQLGTACPQCEGMCAAVCEEKIIKIGSDKLPYLDFSVNGCSDCKACLEACEPGVLNDPEQFITASVRINAAKCMSWSDVMCFSCKEPCLSDAIVFAGVFKPEIHKDACTACGYCIARCPSGAIEVVA